MSRIVSTLLVLLVAGVIVGCLPETAASGPTTEELQQQVDALTRRVESLEKQLKASRARTARPAKPTTTGGTDPLYGKIDRLLAENKIDEAQAALAERKATGEVSAVMNTLTREMGVVGKPTPDAWAIDKWFQGESDVDLDHGTTLLVFWESWCGYCQKELPKMQKVYEELGGEGLQVVGLTRLTKTATEDSARSLIAEKGVRFPIAKESGEMAAYFHVKGIPATAVVRDGKIIWRGHPLRLTHDMLRGWL